MATSLGDRSDESPQRPLNGFGFPILPVPTGGDNAVTPTQLVQSPIGALL
jgi:hypothetical protein